VGSFGARLRIDLAATLAEGMTRGQSQALLRDGTI
jgi:hypothetical protein